MPKDRRVNSSSFDRAMVSPYSCSLKISDGANGSSLLVGDEREWEEARCPICMDHPHNAVLLLCSSREEGCRPFVCDTSYRHSNCLDQLRKTADPSFFQAPFDQQKCELACPLCRGLVTGWDVVQPARKFMNSKTRSCSLETCSFNGNYAELRKHARLEHPSGRPSEASPNRQSNWEALERQREIEDALAHQSDMESNFDEWFNLDQRRYDIWSDESFFDFSSGMSDIENDSIAEMDTFTVALSLFSLCPSSPDEATDSGSLGSSDGPPRSVLPTNSNLRSDNHVGYMSNASRYISSNHSEVRSSYRREIDSMNTRSMSGFERGNDLYLNSAYHREYVPRSTRRRTNYLVGNASTNLRTGPSSRRQNGSNNVSSRSGYYRGNAPTSSNARLSYPRGNGPTASWSRSSYFRQNAPSSSRARPSYFRQDAWPSSSSRARTTFHPREEAYSPVSSRMPHSSHGRRQG